MTLRALIFSLCLGGIAVAHAFAQPPNQTPPPSTAPKPQAPRPAPAPTTTPAAPQPSVAVTPRREGQPINIKVDLTITDQRGTNPMFKKTVSVVTADGMGGFIRSTARYREIGDVPLNVDTQPNLLTDGKIRLIVNLQYDLPATAEPSDRPAGIVGPLQKTMIHENLSLILENGKPIIAAQSADPVGDRQVMIEVKATILR